ncbi:MAG: hypothetical protein QOF49_848, partial [Chloroflexota bacterium]|nr:hypothetical protein [Chloroflexota bacterium]
VVGLAVVGLGVEGSLVMLISRSLTPPRSAPTS